MSAAHSHPEPQAEVERIGRYEVICEIARGGMATVYLAHLGGLGGFRRLVAIKRLHPHLAHETQFVSMFLDEARLVAEIRHPNVVPTLDVSDTLQGLCLVMEYIDGAPLTKLLKQAAQQRRGVSPRVAIRVMLDSLAGLHAAHELSDQEGVPLGLVHRDVSPHNLLVGCDGRTRLLDFGVARARQRLTTTRVGEMKGKLAYMAPEQASGRPIDRRGDIFAAGIVLWECLAGARLFYGTNEADTLGRLLTQPIPPLSDFAPSSGGEPSLPKALDEVVGRALNRNVDERFSSAAEFASELERVATEHDLLGTYEEVAEAVEEAAGEMLEARRMQARDVNSSGISVKPLGSLALATPSGRAEVPTLPEAPAARLPAPSLTDIVPGRLDQRLSLTDVATAESFRPRRGWYIVGGLAALVGLVGGLLLIARGSGDAAPGQGDVSSQIHSETPGVRFADPASEPTAAAAAGPAADNAAPATSPSTAGVEAAADSAGADNADTEAEEAEPEAAPAKGNQWTLAQWKRWKAQQAWKARHSKPAKPAKPTAPAKPGGAEVDNPYR